MNSKGAVHSCCLTKLQLNGFNYIRIYHRTTVHQWSKIRQATQRNTYRTGILLCFNYNCVCYIEWYIFYVFITKPRLRKPSNIIASSLLFNSIFLLLTAAPLTLLEICNDDIAKNHTVVSVRKYISLSYIWLSLTSVAHIGLSRCKKDHRWISAFELPRILQGHNTPCYRSNLFCFNAYHNSSCILL